ncbi:MAG: non-heme iron oxygenase ferredoxin subunit [Nitrospiraceae bacterium]
MSDQWIEVAVCSEIREGRTKLCRVGLLAVCLYKVDGKVYATDDLCTHGQASLADGYLEGDEIVCPLHDGRFCVRTGKATGAPCTVDIKSYSAIIKDGIVLLNSTEFADVPDASGLP